MGNQKSEGEEHFALGFWGLLPPEGVFALSSSSSIIRLRQTEKASRSFACSSTLIPFKQEESGQGKQSNLDKRIHLLPLDE